METWDAMRARRNVRIYEDRPIPAEHLNRILEAGRRAPSAANSQPWDFVLVTAKDQLLALSEVWTGARYLTTAAAAIVLVAPPPDGERFRTIYQFFDPIQVTMDLFFDLGQATISMMLVAADLGIGSGHSAVADQRACRRIVAVPEDHQCPYMLALGYPADRPLRPISSPDRRPFGEVVHRGHW